MVHSTSNVVRLPGVKNGIPVQGPVQPAQAGAPATDRQTGQSPLNADPPMKAQPNTGPENQKPAGTVTEMSEEDKKKTDEERWREDYDRKEKQLRAQFEQEYEELGSRPGAGALYGNTLKTLENKTFTKPIYEKALKQSFKRLSFSGGEQPYIYNPYPDYRGDELEVTNRAKPVPCDGPDRKPMDHIQVFKGVPHNFPQPGIGSFDVLDIDGNMCLERETRLGLYGYQQDGKAARNWDSINWGQLQEKCAEKNSARFSTGEPKNPYMDIYGLAEPTKSKDNKGQGHARAGKGKVRRDSLRTEQKKSVNKEPRTALLIRTYTGKTYSENDKQNIRSLVSELTLQSGGQYHIFLFVHVKDSSYAIWDDDETYQWVLHQSVPPEFVNMTILWNDEAVESTYKKLTRPDHTNVHVAQWLSVQKFAEEFPEFDYIWNWELDSRVTGHHYEFLEKFAKFAKKQPRRELWERNERYYIPSYHGDYDTEFRKEVQRQSGDGSVWGSPKLPFIKPVGPKPPVTKPEEDDYEWGVGEEADLITVAPIFNPINSSWVGAPDVWGYNDSSHAAQDLPRRTTIVTQSRVSRRLLNIMHVENLRGNHVSSEMTPQTVALLHGLKAVYAPMPIWFDRAWSGRALMKWFNPGPKGVSGGDGSAMGWGREGRFGGITWYYRATPPQRLYLNWMGWEDTQIGGPEWEKSHGRPCLPPMMLHPIKDVEPTEPGHTSESRLPYS